MGPTPLYFRDYQRARQPGAPDPLDDLPTVAAMTAGAATGGAGLVPALLAAGGGGSP